MTPYEDQKRIHRWFSEGMTQTQIARRLGLPLTTIHNILKKSGPTSQRVVTKVLGRPKKLCARSLRRINRRLSKNRFISARRLKDQLNLSVSLRTIHRAIRREGFIRLKMRKRPALNDEHKRKRLLFATSALRNRAWEYVIFTDEKKFNLDGPDGYHDYWHHPGTQQPLNFSRAFRPKDGVMIWGGISEMGGMFLAKMPQGKINAGKYIEGLQENFLPEWNQLQEIAPGADWIFYQDNAPVHAAKITKEFLIANNIKTEQAPPCSPDLNPIENVWGILASRVYAGGKTYGSRDELWEAIYTQWNRITESEIKKLIKSMDQRLVEVIQAHGAFTRF